MNRNKYLKKILLGLSGVAYIALAVPAELKWIKAGTVIAVLVFVLAIFMNNIDTFIQEHANKKKLVISATLSMVLGLRFEKVWRYSQKALSLSKIVSISQTTMLYAVGTVLGILSIYFVLGAICFLVDFPMLFFANDEKDSHSSLIQKPMKQLLVFLLLIQGINLVYWGTRKEGYHVDEIYTFELSNYQYTNFVDTKPSYGAWISGDKLHTIIEPDGSELFNITVPYWNSETDNHPMIYYILVNFNSSVCGLLGIDVNKWIGLIPNFAAAIVSTVVLVCLFFCLTNNALASVAAGLVFSLNAYSVSISVYLRMYALLILSCCVFVFLHLEFDRREQNNTLDSRFMRQLELVTAAGILTQYYFLIFAFFMCLLTFFSLLIKKKWNIAKGYFITEFYGVFLAELFFPRMFVRLFFGDRGTQAIQYISKGNYALELQQMVELIHNELFPSFSMPILIFGLIMLAYVGFLVIKKAENNIENLFIIKLFTTIVLYCLIVARIVPFMSDRYFSCVFPFIFLCVLYSFYRIVQSVTKSLKNSAIATVTTLVLIVICIITDGYISQTIHYIYDDYSERRESIEAYGDIPVIVLNKDVYDDSSLKWINELDQYTSVYLCRHGSIEDIKEAMSYDIVTDRFLLYAHFYEEDSDELTDILGQYQSTLLSSVGQCPVYYCELTAIE